MPRKKSSDYLMVSEPTIIMRQNGLCIRPFQPGDRNHQYSRLEHLTSYYDEVTFGRVRINGFPLDTMDGTGECMFVCSKNSPTFIHNLYPDYNMIIESPWDTYKMYPKVAEMNSSFIPSEIQWDMISRYNDLRNKEAVYITMPTASGKTLTGIYIACAYGKRILILCYKKEILLQWKKSLLEFTDIDEDQILVLKDGAHIMKLYNNMKDPEYQYEGPSVVLSTTTLMGSIISHHGPDVFTDIIRRFGFGMKVIDEAHRHLANIVKINALTNIPRTLYMSAEFRRANDLMNKYFFSTFHDTNILTSPEELAEDFKYTIGVVVEYNSYPTDLEVDECFGRRGFSEFNYMKYQIDKGVILNVIDELVDKIVSTNDGTKIIVFVNMIDHVDLLFSHFVAKYGGRRTITRLHGGVEDGEKALVDSDADLIISTYKSLDTGRDISNIKHIISCVPVDIICDNQAAGRSRPLPDGSLCFYYILSDTGFSYIRKRTKKRLESLYTRKLVDCYKIHLRGE